MTALRRPGALQGSILVAQAVLPTMGAVQAKWLAMIAAGLIAIGGIRSDTGFAAAAFVGLFGAGLLMPTPLTWTMQALPFAARERGTAVFQSTFALGQFGSTLSLPAFILADGERTGRFRSGGDTALTAEGGPTRISFADYAIALVDEIETPRHHRQRFSVAY